MYYTKGDIPMANKQKKKIFNFISAFGKCKLKLQCSISIYISGELIWKNSQSVGQEECRATGTLTHFLKKPFGSVCLRRIYQHSITHQFYPQIQMPHPSSSTLNIPQQKKCMQMFTTTDMYNTPKNTICNSHKLRRLPNIHWQWNRYIIGSIFTQWNTLQQ